jgi:hypothetical protein
MQIARPVGLSQDGRSLLVATPTGEQLAIPVDDRLHAALRGDRPRLGQLEIEMDNALGPRDIQARIRAGQSLEEVGRVAGLPLDRVERFAAPVLAEREHVALVAMSSSVRRRGETSGHRVLRLAVNERLEKRGVDTDTVDWDAFRQENGRWSVSARYSSGEASRQAVFSFDLQGRFSVADNDEARWLLGEQSAVKGPQPGRRRPVVADAEDDPDTEPTLDLNDQLALVRAIQPPAGPDQAVSADGSGTADEPAEQGQPDGNVRALYSVSDPVSGTETDDSALELNEHEGEDREDEEPGSLDDQGAGSSLDNLAGMLSSEDEEYQSVYGGLSDASAVPETDLSGWEPGVVVDYPVEPAAEPDQDSVREADDSDSDSDAEADAESAATASAPAAPPAPADSPARPARRKRAAVPSWDEIMFGGPPRSG